MLTQTQTLLITYIYSLFSACQAYIGLYRWGVDSTLNYAFFCKYIINGHDGHIMESL